MKVLIVEDDPGIVEVVSMSFEIRWPGAKVLFTHMGEKAAELVESEKPDVVILDLGLPDISGFDVLKEIRAFSDVPVLILTVRGEETDVVKGLEWGADDYMTKPFRHMELLARVKALIRRASPSGGQELLTCGELTFDPSVRQLLRGQREIALTRTEGTILYQLMINAGRAVTHSALAEAVWGEDYPGAADSIRVYIRRLREKIEPDPDQPQLIITKPSIGYLLVKPD